MNVITQIFGRKLPSSDAISKEIASHNAEKGRELSREAQAKAALANVAVLTDTEHATAEANLVSARRSLTRIEARINELQAAHAEAVEAETLAAMKTRAEAVKRRVGIDAPKALDRYDGHAQRAADAASEYQDICSEVEAVNAELRKAGLPLIESPETLYRKEPDQVIAEQRVARTKFVRWNHREGREDEIGITAVRDGRRVPLDGHGNIVADAREVDDSYSIPAKTLRGTSLPSLTENLSLPPARVGSVRHWPKA